MRCLACDATNPPTNRFCGSCGIALSAICQHCDHKNAPSAQLCDACGGELRPVRNGPAPGRAVGHPPLAERKQGTVLFADIVGSTQLIAELDPEQAMERLRPSLEQMCAAVQRFDGTVVRTLGDGIMAVFGAPRAQEAHALLACQAAIAIRRAFEAQIHSTEVRIGLHSGELVISQDEDRPDPLPHGVTIHLASRLEQMAEPGGICLTGDCYRQVETHCDARYLGKREAKGFSEPIETYVLQGFKPAVASQHFRTTKLTPFRGRETELQKLWQALHDTENGEARVIGVSGAAGAGKSRLCYEFAEWCRLRSIPVLEARAFISGQATPLQPILEFLHLLLGVSSSDSQAAARERTAQHPATAGPDQETDLPLLFQFLGIEALSSDNPSRRVPQPKSHLRSIVGHMVKQMGMQPLVIIFEDLHWLDAGSAEFVAEIVQAIRGTRTMLVLNVRQSYTAEWMANSFYEQLSLGELGEAQTTDLVEQLIGKHVELSPIMQKIAARCGGNPFFAEELVRSLSERDVICGKIGEFRLGSKSDSDLLPASVQATISARIDRLEAQDKTILHIAAIIGKEFPLSIVEDVTGLSKEQLLASADRLHSAHLVEPRFGSDDQGYFFRHPLVQEVAYNEQLKSTRIELHAAIAAALERQYAAKLDEISAMISHHYEAAGQLVSAAKFAIRAAVWIGSTASALALQYWHKVLRLLSDQPNEPELNRLRMRANGQIAIFGWREGMTAEQVKPFIEEALGWARKIDTTMTSLLLAADGRISVASGRSADDYAARIKEALALDCKEPSPGRAATLNALFCHAKWLAGCLNKALAANSWALQNVSDISAFDEQFLGLDVEQWMRSLRGRILVRLGQFGEAEKNLQQVLSIDQSRLDPAVQFIPHLAYVDLAYFGRNPAVANEHALHISAIAEKIQNPYLTVYALGCLGTARLVEGEFDAAASKLIEGIEFAKSAKAALEFEPEMMATLADCHYQMEDFEKAETIAQQAIEVAQQRGARLAVCRASVISASVIHAAHGVKRQTEAIERLTCAEDLIRYTGAEVFLDRVAQVRALISNSSPPAAAQEG